jgi:hypothetical protein
MPRFDSGSKEQLLKRGFKRGLRRAGLAIGLIAAIAPALAEPQLVATVTGPLAKRIRPGQFLKDGLILRLGKADHVVVVDRKGARAFTGPQSVVLNRDPPLSKDQQSVVDTLIRGKEPIVRLAGVRGLGTKTGGEQRVKLNPYAQIVIPAKSFKIICVAERSTLILERDKRRSGSEAFTVTHGEAKALATFAPGHQRTPWPETLYPSANNPARYQLSGKGVAGSISLVPVTENSLDWLALGTFLTAQKCSNTDWILAKRDWDEAHVTKP